MNVLLVEDERPLALALNRILTQSGLKVTWASDGQKGIELASSDEYDVLVLDVLLPIVNGWEVCRRLRAARINVPIIMLTALDETEEKIRGLNLGADDYLPKPFEADELVARVKALLRRDKVNKGAVICVDDLEIDREQRRVVRAEAIINLTRREYDLLEVLAINEGRVLSREVLLERVWRNEETYSNIVDVFIGTLRKKIDAPFSRRLIHTVIGFGYVLRSESD
jgi:two-component system copper resistance phosphate regulon response regulator CusR